MLIYYPPISTAYGHPEVYSEYSYKPNPIFCIRIETAFLFTLLN